MGYADQKGSLIMSFILLSFLALFISGFYKSVNKVDTSSPELITSLDNQDVLEEHLPGFFDAKIINKDVNLQKGHKKIIDKTGMVFKGVSQGNVLLDLYVLEMDPDAFYALHFSKETFRQGIWLENIKYRLVSVNGNALRLKIMDAY